MNYSSHIAWQNVAGEVVIIDLKSGTAVGLNGTAGEIWTALENDESDAIARNLSERFSIPVDQARSDVDEFVAEMLARGFLH